MNYKYTAKELLSQPETLELKVKLLFDNLELKINQLQRQVNNIMNVTETESSLKLKLQKIEIQINEILRKYDKLSRNEMDFEEKIMFANYLINLVKKGRIRSAYKEDVDNVVDLMKSSNIHDKVIGIDNFMALAHGGALSITEAFSENIYEYDDKNLDKIASDFMYELNKKIVIKLNEIRNRKNLGKVKDAWGFKF